MAKKRASDDRTLRMFYRFFVSWQVLATVTRDVR